MGPRYPRVLLVGLAEPPRPAPVVQRAANGHAAVAGAVRAGLCEARKRKIHFRVQLLNASARRRQGLVEKKCRNTTFQSSSILLY